MRRVTFSAIAAVALALGAYTMAGAQAPAGQAGPNPDGSGRPGRGGGALMMLRGLDLSDQQRDQIRAFVEAQRATLDPESGVGPLHRQLQAELFADAPDRQKIAALQQQLAQAHAARLAAEVALTQQIAQVLTAEQRQTQRERLARAPERRGPGGRGPRDGPAAPRLRGQGR